MSESTLAGYIECYKEWLGLHARSVLAEIRIGLSLLEQRRLCQEYDLALSQDAVELYAQMDGQDELGRLAALPLCSGEMGLRLLPLQVAAALRQNLLGADVLYEASERRQYEAAEIDAQRLWKANWLPIAEARDEHRGRYQKLILDLEPGRERDTGLVLYEHVTVLSEREVVVRKAIAQTLSAFFRDVLSSLARGDLVFRGHIGLSVAG